MLPLKVITKILAMSHKCRNNRFDLNIKKVMCFLVTSIEVKVNRLKKLLSFKYAVKTTTNYMGISFLLLFIYRKNVYTNIFMTKYVSQTRNQKQEFPCTRTVYK